MYYISFIIVIISGAFYHITQKSISEGSNPFLSLFITYLVAITVSFFLYLTSKNTSFLLDVKAIKPASYFLGFVIVGLEMGFLIAYRSGWNIGKLSMINSITVALILIPVGIFMFGEHISTKSIVGIIISIIGLVIMRL
ncbi:EamA family transporter [Helicovermis profundi]|uniref:Membrane protein n=1 Tax=Helicovermis profundi TaxID=3065157 RepID=A0AAU9EMP5_9FIRM|nr:membrane protein [Clostridia bacterium S502]